MSYVKLFGTILHSTIWREPAHVRLVWITMLVMVNRDGVVEASLPGLADAARVSVEECEEAIERLSSPDRYSRSLRDDGRRVRVVDGGWELLNYEVYRKRMSQEDQRQKAAQRQNRFRNARVTHSNAPSRPVTPSNADATPSNASNDIEEAEEEVDQDHVEFALDGSEPSGTFPASAPTTATKSPDVRRVFEAWKVSAGHPRAMLDKKRASRIAARLRDGFTVEQLLEVLANWRNDPYLAGSSGRIYDGIETLFRDVAQVERLIALTTPARPKSANGAAAANGGADYYE